MNTQDFIDDIPRNVAIRANAGTSFDTERRGDTEVSEYVSTLATDFEMLSTYAVTDEKRAIFDSEFARYREGYKARMLAYLHSKGRCWSPMIIRSCFSRASLICWRCCTAAGERSPRVSPGVAKSRTRATSPASFFPTNS